jgi:hypothetical protein
MNIGICVKSINTILNDMTYLETRIELQPRSVVDDELQKYLNRKKNILSIEQLSFFTDQQMQKQ